jgi:hypothetical protein
MSCQRQSLAKSKQQTRPSAGYFNFLEDYTMTRNHGGPRQNSGRKPTHGPLVAVTVRISKPEHARLQAVRAQGLTCRQVLMQGVQAHELH